MLNRTKEGINMVSYDRLWKTMEKKGATQYRLISHYKISAGQIGRMKKNMHVFRIISAKRIVSI